MQIIRVFFKKNLLTHSSTLRWRSQSLTPWPSHQTLTPPTDSTYEKINKTWKSSWPHIYICTSRSPTRATLPATRARTVVGTSWSPTTPWPHPLPTPPQMGNEAKHHGSNKRGGSMMTFVCKTASCKWRSASSAVTTPAPWTTTPASAQATPWTLTPHHRREPSITQGGRWVWRYQKEETIAR